MSDDPRFTLHHVPAGNDPDDTRETLAAQLSPAAIRCTDAIVWQADTGITPTRLIDDVRAWIRGHCAREGPLSPACSLLTAYAVAGYLLGRRDAAVAPDDDTAPNGALAWLCGALSGSVVTLGLGLIGYWLAH